MELLRAEQIVSSFLMLISMSSTQLNNCARRDRSPSGHRALCRIHCDMESLMKSLDLSGKLKSASFETWKRGS